MGGFGSCPRRAIRSKSSPRRWTSRCSAALGPRDPAKGGHPGFDPVLKFCILVLQTLHGLSLEQAEYLVADRLSWMRFTDSAAAPDGARLREGLIDPNNAASDLWADSAYRSAENERFLARMGKVSRIHQKGPKGRPMPKRTARANAAKSAVRIRVEHPFAHENGPMALVIRTIGLARANATVMLANMAYNMKRWCRLDRQSAPA